MAQPEPDQDRRALAHHRAVLKYERRDLCERIHAFQLLEPRARLPARRLDPAEGNIRNAQRSFGGRGARAFRAIEREHQYLRPSLCAYTMPFSVSMNIRSSSG